VCRTFVIKKIQIQCESARKPERIIEGSIDSFKIFISSNKMKNQTNGRQLKILYFNLRLKKKQRKMETSFVLIIVLVIVFVEIYNTYREKSTCLWNIRITILISLKTKFSIKMKPYTKILFLIVFGNIGK
jgi:hypothetical protein